MYRGHFFHHNERKAAWNAATSGIEMHNPFNSTQQDYGTVWGIWERKHSSALGYYPFK